MNFKVFTLTLVFLFSSIYVNANPALSEDESVFEDALICTQSKIQPLLSGFINHSVPLIESMSKYIDLVEQICIGQTVVTLKAVQPILESLIDLQSKLNTYENEFESGSNYYESKENLDDHLSGNSDNSLTSLYSSRAIHWDWDWDASRDVKDEMISFYRTQETFSDSAAGHLNFIYGKLKYHNEFNTLDLDVLIKFLPILKNLDRCKVLTGDFYDFAKNKIIPTWNKLLEFSQSNIIIGEPNQKPKQCQ